LALKTSNKNRKKQTVIPETNIPVDYTFPVTKWYLFFVLVVIGVLFIL